MSLYALVRNWWWVALRGLFAGVFILVAFLGSYAALVTLVVLFGAYALVDGLVVLIAGVTHSHGARPVWLLLLEGLTGVGAGVLAFVLPDLAAVGLLYLLAGWAIVSGALAVAAAIHWRGVVAKARVVAIGLGLAVALAALLMLWPAPVSLGLFWLVAAYTLIFGLLQVGLGLRVRNWQNRWMRPLRLLPVEVAAQPVARGPQAP
jgi:uncharacterized membrane protein HdeD (DUF308 family)